MQTLTIGAYRATLAPTRDVGAFQAKLAKCNGKSRRLPLRDLRTKAGFPVFEPGMSTAEYVRLYSSGDGSQLKAWEWAQLNDAPCTLYSGADTCETLPDGFETWEDFDAAQSADAAPESTMAAANDDAAPTVPDPEPAAHGEDVAAPVCAPADDEPAETGAAWFERIIAENKAKRDDCEARAQKVAPLDSVPFKHSDGERFGIAGPCMSEPGRFRFSYFDSRGAIGHCTRDTLALAMWEALDLGYLYATEDTAPVDPLPTQSDSVPVPGKLDAAPDRIEPDIFIRRATSAERMGNAPRQRAMRSLVPMAGHTVMFKPYGHKGAGFYWVLDRRADTLPSESDNAAPIECEPVTDVADLDTHERPCAAPGLISYRARGNYGWIMIGAADDADAMREAMRSTHAPTNLQRWDGTAYVPCDHEAATPATHSEPAPARPVYANDHLAWLDVENDRAEPDEYQARLIECFGDVKARGLFYNSETYPATAALMTERYGYPDWRGDRGQSDGVANPFGMDCYRANCVIRARAERERERGAAATFTVGQRFARLIFNDGKQRTAAELVTLDPAGFACKLKAKSGRNSVEVTCSAYALSLAVIRAEERGKVLAAKRASARPEPIAPMPAEPAPVPSKSEPETLMLSHVLGALQCIAPDGIPDAAMLAREADRIEATAERMRDAMPDYSATCATVARDLRTLADSAIDPLPGKSEPEALDDDETIPAPLDGLDVAELDDMVEFERAGGIAQPIAPAYRDDAPRATPTPSLRIPAGDPRARIPARFARVYLLQA